MNNRIKRHVYIYLLLYLCICQVQGQNPQFSFSRKYKNEKLLIAGCGWRKIAVIDKKTGNPEWEHALGKGEDCNDIELTRKKHSIRLYLRSKTYHSFARSGLGLQSKSRKRRVVYSHPTPDRRLLACHLRSSGTNRGIG